MFLGRLLRPEPEPAALAGLKTGERLGQISQTYSHKYTHTFTRTHARTVHRLKKMKKKKKKVSFLHIDNKNHAKQKSGWMCF